MDRLKIKLLVPFVVWSYTVVYMNPAVCVCVCMHAHLQVHTCKGSSSVALSSLVPGVYVMNDISVNPLSSAINLLHEMVLSRKYEATYMLVMWESFGARLI
jgi:hypothetical protein